MLILALLSLSWNATAAPPAQEPAPGAEAALGTGFTYQGWLTRSAEPVTATCRMAFRVYNAQNGGVQVGNEQVINAVSVTDGLFTVTLNGSGQFGPNFANGQERWLQVSVRCGGEQSDTTLPRQAIRAAPYALTALSANGLAGRNVSATAPQNGQVLGWNGTEWAPQNSATGDVTAVTAGQGLNGGGTSGDLSLALNTTFTDNRYWRRTGNAGTNPDNNFLGTTDNQALELRVNNQRALRVEPAERFGSPAPNIIHGVTENGPTDGAVGIAIGGGGEIDSPNRVHDHYGTVSGGQGNEAGTDDGDPSGQMAATVAGGANNIAGGANAVVSGGTGNRARGLDSTIGGGVGNEASAEASTIGGGAANEAAGILSTIPGGLAARAPLWGQFAYSSGYFDSFAPPGQAQMSIYLLRRSTATGTTDAELFLDGESRRLTIEPGRTMVFDISIAARSTSGNMSAGYRFWGVIANDASTTRLLGSVLLNFFEDGGGTAFDAEVLADDDNDALRIEVTNATGQTVRWVAVVHATEVSQR